MVASARQNLNNAGIKVTDLPAATTPFLGTEVMMVVQSGLSKQALVTDVIAMVANRVVYASPAGPNNNVAPPGFDANTRYLDVDTTAGAAQWTGLLAGANGQRVVVTPIGAGSLRLDALAGGSVAANQFRAAANTMLITNLSTEIEYSSGVGKWLVIP
jgi:hypothetical protein